MSSLAPVEPQALNTNFPSIPKGNRIEKAKITEEPILQPIVATYQDPNIQIPMVVASYRTPSMKTREARILDMISSLLSDGKSSRLYKRMVDDKKMALQIGSFNFSQEDYSMYIIYGLPMTGFTNPDLIKEIDAEILKLQTELIPERDFEKLQNVFENKYVSSNATLEGVASNLATFHLLYGNTHLINDEMQIYTSVTREEIREVAKKYLQSNQRLLLDYIPKKDKIQN